MRSSKLNQVKELEEVDIRSNRLTEWQIVMIRQEQTGAKMYLHDHIKIRRSWTQNSTNAKYSKKMECRPNRQGT